MRDCYPRRGVSGWKANKKMENETKPPLKMSVARDGQIFGEYLGKELRGLKTQGILNPSDHIYKNGQWQMLFKVSKGYFWESQDKPKYDELFESEKNRVRQNTEAYLKLVEETEDANKKNEYKTLHSNFLEVGSYLEEMYAHQTKLWSIREIRRKEFEERVRQNQKEMLEEEIKDYWKNANKYKKQNIRLFYKFLKKALTKAKSRRADYCDFLNDGDADIPCLDWHRTISEEEFSALASNTYDDAQLLNYAERMWLAFNQDEVSSFGLCGSKPKTNLREIIFSEFLRPK